MKTGPERLRGGGRRSGLSLKTVSAEAQMSKQDNWGRYTHWRSMDILKAINKTLVFDNKKGWTYLYYISSTYRESDIYINELST